MFYIQENRQRIKQLAKIHTIIKLTGIKKCAILLSMSIITPSQLWESFDRHTPLCPTIVSQKDTPFIDKRLYFSGLKTESGCIRIYARFLSVPSDAVQNNPALILLPPAHQSIDTMDAEQLLALFDNRYSILLVDYFGAGTQKTHHSIYPKAKNNYWKTDLYTCPTDIKTSAHYYFTTCALFALSYLEEYYKDLNIDKDKLGILGINEGASLVYKASIDKGIKCGATFFCGDLFGANQDNIAYKAALDSRVYAAKTDFPVLINAATNQKGGEFDYLNELYLSGEQSRLSIFALSSNAVSDEQRDNLIKWFDLAMNNGCQKIPCRPKISASVSEGANYIELEGEFDNVKMYIAESGIADYRNWKIIKHTKISENKYLARLDGSSQDHKLFASVLTKCGFNLSSEMIDIAAVRNVADQTKRGRIIYKIGYKDSGWLIRGSDFFKTDVPIIAKGPFELEGIKAKRLTTYAAGDMINRGEAGSLLQIVLHTKVPSVVEFILTTSHQSLDTSCQPSTEVFRHKKNIIEKDWAMISLSPEDFKSAKGLPVFDRVIGIELRAEEDVLIGSVIWV